MSLLRVAELQLHQEIEDEGLRESLRQHAENTRNLQAQIDELQAQINTIDTSGSSTSAASSSVSDSLIYAIALG